MTEVMTILWSSYDFSKIWPLSSGFQLYRIEGAPSTAEMTLRGASYAVGRAGV